MRTPTLAVRVQLPFGWNTLCFSIQWYYELCVENRWPGGCAWIVGGWGVVGWGKESNLGPAEIASFSRRYFRRSNKHGPFWCVTSTGYFYVLFLWNIGVSGFRPLESYRKLGLPLSTIFFPVSSHEDNHLYKYYTVWNFFIKMHVKVLTKVFYIQIWFKCETPLLFFLIRTLVYIKNSL